MKKLILLLISVCCLLLAGCKAKQIIIHDTQYIDRVKVDSVNVFKHDSIRITQKGDTVFYQVFKTLYKDKIRIKIDSVYKYIDKPVPVEKIVKVSIEKKLTWYQQTMIVVGEIASGVFIMWLLWFLAKNFNPIAKFFSKIFGNQK
ncbi:MAG: hypothetical protein QM800_12665 [Paludibacter sp.]